MITTKLPRKTWKSVKSETSKRNSKKDSVSEVIIEKKISNNSEPSVSIFTKTTNPKVIIQSEKVGAPQNIQNIHRHRILKFVCLIVMSVIILMTFFLSLKTYNTVNELHQILNQIN
jgi:hypothetical protein